MKKIRRSLALLTVLSSLIVGIGAIGASPAAAAGANCSVTHVGTVPSGGYVATDVKVYNCTNVSAFRFKYYVTGYSFTTGWLDDACGCYANGMLGDTYHAFAYADLLVNSPGPGTNHVWIEQAAWWYGACRPVEPRYFWQIQNSITHTWGGINAVAVGPTTLCF